MASIGRYWHTLRHLRPVQVYGRAWFRLARPRPSTGAAPPRREAAGPWVAPAPHAPSLTGPSTLSFLGETRDIDRSGWDDPAVGKLWRYNLHYFDDLSAPAVAERLTWQRALIERWIAENPPAAGSGWEPYPTSLRMVNWIKWSLAGNELSPAALHSLAVQARWLTRRLEYHLLGNHLFANAKALVFAGCFFRGPEAEAWLARGLHILAREIPEQVLADGGHFERSPMYHAIAVEDMLDLVNVVRAHAPLLPGDSAREAGEWPERARAMLAWLVAMCHPDGEISFFNDAALGIAPDARVLLEYARRLGIDAPPVATGLVALSDSGYIRVAGGPAVALLDVAPIGPDYLPGHAHADTLSFELSLFGERVFVNSGTSVYGTGPERSRQRGTAAHNTVAVDGEDSSEVWSGFRVARRARPIGLDVTPGPPVTVRCSHDGYTRLPGGPVHTRQWTISSDDMTIHDRVTGDVQRAEARLHLAPTVGIADVAGNGAQLLDCAGRRIAVTVQRGRLRMEPSTWHPRFGASIPSRCLVVALDGGEAAVRVSWGGQPQ